MTVSANFIDEIKVEHKIQHFFIIKLTKLLLKLKLLSISQLFPSKFSTFGQENEV